MEVYDKSSNRFFTVTGHRFGDVTTIEDRQEQFNDVYRTVFASLGGSRSMRKAPSRSLPSRQTGQSSPTG